MMIMMMIIIIIIIIIIIQCNSLLHGIWVGVLVIPG